MNLIPVIDLKNGQVVIAQQGQRNSYQPIHSNLSNSSSIEDIIKGYLSIYPFKNIYIADLNDITGDGSNKTLINSTIHKYSSVKFWVDSGKSACELPAITDIKYRPIIGSESQKSAPENNPTDYSTDYILSLDFFPQQGYLGPIELLNNSSLWPKDIIIMTLDKVGINQGPDFEKLKDFQQKFTDKNFIAAGGVRDIADLIQLRQIGIHHALVASALHSGAINSEAIKKLISST